MGLLDKLFGRGKAVASGVIDKAGDVAEKGMDVAGDAARKGMDVAGDVYEKGKDVAGDAYEKGKDLIDRDDDDEAKPASGGTGSGTTPA
jgi:hypothetical protein